MDKIPGSALGDYGFAIMMKAAFQKEQFFLLDQVILIFFRHADVSFSYINKHMKIGSTVCMDKRGGSNLVGAG